MRKSTQHMLIIVILVFLVEPYVIQGAYRPNDLVLYDPTGSDATDPVITDFHTYYTYYNSTGDLIQPTPTETQAGNGTWTFPFDATAQDVDLKALISVTLADGGSESDTWNDTALDSATADSIVAMGMRITTAGDTGIFSYKCGLATKTDFFTGYIRADADAISMIYFGAGFQAWLDDYAVQAADDAFHIYIWEEDAVELVDGAVIELELHFYSTLSTDTFNEYMLYAGALNIMLAIGMTSAWNPTRSSVRRRRRRRRRR